MPSKANGYGEERQNHPNRQVSRETFGPHNLPPGMFSDEGPDNDDWIHGAYFNQSKPNPGYIGKPGGS